jgi:hypothetical protein
MFTREGTALQNRQFQTIEEGDTEQMYCIPLFNRGVRLYQTKDVPFKRTAS